MSIITAAPNGIHIHIHPLVNFYFVIYSLVDFQALIVHKPAGINKHFSVGLVSEKLTEQLGRPVLACSIWKKLRTMFDLAAVDDREEAIPFPIDVRKVFV
jgi:hypothetical protein